MSSLKGLVLAFIYSLSSFGVMTSPSMEFLSASKRVAKLDSFKFWDAVSRNLLLISLFTSEILPWQHMGKIIWEAVFPVFSDIINSFNNDFIAFCLLQTGRL